MSKTPEHICRLLVGLYRPKGVAPKAFQNSVQSFEGVIQTLIGKCDELITSRDLEPDGNRTSESWFVHAFRDAVLTEGRDAAARFFPSYKETRGRSITISLPLSETDRAKAINESFPLTESAFSRLSDDALLKKARAFDAQVSDFENPYRIYMARSGKNDLLERLEEKVDSANGTPKEPVKSNASERNEPVSIVLYGPPGTGKTVVANHLAKKILEGNKINLDPEQIGKTFVSKDEQKKKPDTLRFFATQFHPSFSYEDFFEGIRPVSTLSASGSDVSYMVIPGTFKVICQLARAYYQPGDYGIDVILRYQKSSEGGAWFLESGLADSVYRLNERPGYCEVNGMTVLGTGGKSEKQEFTPESSGVFQGKWFYDGSDSQAPFVLFIDELNRGNPARIFGEALSLIEESKRLGSEAAELVLPYSHEKFVVPPNLNIICAMNSSDKSLSSLDQAFRRRFKFVYLAPTFDVVLSPDFKKDSRGKFSDELLSTLIQHFTAINQALRATRVPQENFIGHYYLFKVLRDAYSRGMELTKAKEKVPPLEELVRDSLKATWENTLHGQIRELVGDLRLKEFAQNFSKESAKDKSNLGFVKTQQSIEDSLFSYLDNIQPINSAFPWKKAA